VEFGPLSLKTALLETASSNRKINTNIIPFSKELLDAYCKNQARYPSPFISKKRKIFPAVKNSVVGEDMHIALVEELQRKNISFSAGSVPSRNTVLEEVETLSTPQRPSQLSSSSMRALHMMAKKARELEGN
jgi:hypothetical protein